MKTFIDLFCGIGGFRIGMQEAGFKCVMSCDIDSECRKTYQSNFKEEPLKDIYEINEKKIPDHDVLCAGFPCQPFSISGKLKGFQDKRGVLFFEILRIVKEKQPKVILLENVKHLIHHNKGETLKVIVSELETLGYFVSWKVLNLSDFGLPQNRERIIIIASKEGAFNFDSLVRKPHVQLKDFLDTENHFDYLNESEYTLIDNPKVQKSGLIFVGYLNKSIRKNGVRPGTINLSRVHKQPNRIYSSEGIHPTLTSQETAGRNYILHNGRVRKLTIDECWRIMGFPENFVKVSSLSSQYRQLGNSVGVPMVTALAEEIKRQFLKGKLS